MPTFQIIFQGKILDGYSLDEVKKNIAVVFNKDIKQIEGLFSGKPVVIKNDIDESTALKYQAVFKKAGALCELKAMTTGETPKVVTAKIEGSSKTRSMSAKSKTRDVVDIPFSYDFSGLSLAEPGVILMKSHEITEIQIEDFSMLTLAERGALLSEPKEVVPFIIEDISGLTLENTDSFPRPSAD